MSTKAIRMTLEWAREQVADSLERPFSRDQTKLDEFRLEGLNKALAEVAAIERVAKAIDRDSMLMDPKDREFVESIARDAP